MCETSEIRVFLLKPFGFLTASLFSGNAAHIQCHVQAIRCVLGEQKALLYPKGGGDSRHYKHKTPSLSMKPHTGIKHWSFQFSESRYLKLKQSWKRTKTIICHLNTNTQALCFKCHLDWKPTQSLTTISIHKDQNKWLGSSEHDYAYVSRGRTMANRLLNYCCAVLCNTNLAGGWSPKKMFYLLRCIDLYFS